MSNTENNTKTCTQCRASKPLDEFHRDARLKTGRISRCKPCVLENKRVYYAANKEKMRVRSRAYWAENSKAVNAERRRRYAEDPEYRARVVEGVMRHYWSNREEVLGAQRERRARTRNRIRERNRSYYAKNRTRLIEDKRQYYRRERERVLLRTKAWLEENPWWRESNRDKFRERVRRWRAKNPGQVTAQAAQRRAARTKATPLWADRDKIKALYVEARRMRDNGEDVHVDHIVPLNHPDVCGLHVPWNLQVIPATENLRKSNKLTPDAARRLTRLTAYRYYPLK